MKIPILGVHIVTSKKMEQIKKTARAEGRADAFLELK